MDKLNSYAKNLTESIAKGQISVKNGVVHKSQSFDATRYSQLSKFANNYFTNRLAGFADTNNVSELSALFNKAMVW